jgi:hypothetical protein
VTRFLFIQGPGDRTFRYWATDGKFLVIAESFETDPLEKDQPVLGIRLRLEIVNGIPTEIYAAEPFRHPRYRRP